jgi:3'(2'), 5'-bisphosphate nucleotidase
MSGYFAFATRPKVILSGQVLPDGCRLFCVVDVSQNSCFPEPTLPQTAPVLSDSDLHTLGALSLKAGAAILEIYAQDFDVAFKGDESPVTAADLAANAILTEGLDAQFGHIPLISEEDGQAHKDLEGFEGAFFLIDPLDGTKEFVGRRPDFTVNIALIYNRKPLYGLIYAPVRKALYIGDVAQGRAWYHEGDDADALPPLAAFTPLRIRKAPETGLGAVSSKSHSSPSTDAWLEQMGSTERLSIGSSLKFCLVAQGDADIYPRFGPTMEWDTGAGDAILRAAGGRVLDHDGFDLTYAKPGFRNPEFFALGDAAFVAPQTPLQETRS